MLRLRFRLSADRRNVVVFELEGPSLVVRDAALPGAFAGDTVYLPDACRRTATGRRSNQPHDRTERVYQGGRDAAIAELEKKRNLILTDARGHRLRRPSATPRCFLRPPRRPGQFCHLVIQLDVREACTLAADSFLLGNVAPASHGETVHRRDGRQRRCVRSPSSAPNSEAAAHLAFRRAGIRQHAGSQSGRR